MPANTPWFGYPISQAYGANGEQGIDLATPFNTPITALYAGTVRWAGRTQWSCGSSGGEVTIVVNVPGLGVFTSYYLHLNTVTVKTGDQVPAGQVIGYSGGQTQGGNWPVVNCPSKGLIYSTGPHTEFGFNASWVSGPGHHIDPTFAISQARNGTLPATSPDGSYQTLADASTGAALQVDPTALEAGLLGWYWTSSITHRQITQATGWDGICEALDYAEAWRGWNWFNPFESIARNVPPWFIRALFATIAFFVFLYAVHDLIAGAASNVARVAAPIVGGIVGGPPGAAVGAATALSTAPTAPAQ